MASDARERKSQRLFWALILLLILGYALIKAQHIAVALDAYDGQPLVGQTEGAAK